MAITTKNRKDLKSNFVKNAIPTEQNFADLVDAQINQADDGVFKLAGEPFSVVAAGGDQKRALRLYANYPAANPDWMISLNPAQTPGDAATNRPGFGITDGAGNTRLFLDASGRLGLGTNEPQGAIDVRLGPDAWQRFVVANSPAWGDAGVEHVTIGAGGASGIMFSNPHVVWNGDRASIRYGRTSGTAGETYWDVGVRSDGRFGFSALDNGGAGELVTISKAGLLRARSGVVVDGSVGHIDADGAFYRNTDGQVYLTVDDNLYIRDLGAASWAAQFDTNTGSLNLKGALTALTGVKASGNGGVIDLEGTDHGYIQFFPQKRSGNRKAWIGFGNPGSAALGITSEAGDLALSATANTSITSTNLAIAATTTVRGGLAVNDGSDTGVKRGLQLWNTNDSNHVIYSASPQGKSPANQPAVAGFHNAGHRLRFRTYAGQGFLFENHNEVAVADLTSDTGALWTRGRATFAGGLTIPAGQPVAGVPIVVFRSVKLTTSDHAWKTDGVAGRWVWQWSETFQGTVVSATVALGAYFIQWGRSEALKTMQVEPEMTGFTNNVVNLKTTFGWRDFSGNWDDNLDASSFVTVVVMVQLAVAQ